MRGVNTMLPTVTAPWLLLAGVSLLAVGCAGPASHPAAASLIKHLQDLVAAEQAGRLGKPAVLVGPVRHDDGHVQTRIGCQRVGERLGERLGDLPGPQYWSSR